MPKYGTDTCRSEILSERSLPVGSTALVRSRRNKILGGVCGGIAQFVGWDPTLVRVIYVLVSFFSAAFPGILVYLILWVVMPKES